MSVPHAEKLIERARAGERLNSKDRRHCVGFLMATDSGSTNAEVGEIFQVTERQIRFDKKYIREDRAKLIKEDDIGLVIADIAMSFDVQVRDIEKSKKKCEIGSRTYLEHCRAVFDLQMKKVKALQDLGYYPKNLGNMSVERYEWKSEVAKDGSVNTRPVDLINASKEEITDADFEELPRAS